MLTIISLECPVNLTCIGESGAPREKLTQVLGERANYTQTAEMRTRKLLAVR